MFSTIDSGFDLFNPTHSGSLFIASIEPGFAMGADSNNRWKLASRHASHSAISSDLVPDDQIPPCVSNVILANSWILSLVFHLGLIVTLSLVSYTLQTGTEIELEFTSSSADAPTVTIESLETSDSKSGDNLDNEINQLLASSQRPLNLEINAASFEFDPVMSLQNTDGSNESTINATEGLLKSDSKIGNGNQAQFFGIQAKGKNFVFIVDSSSSMSGARWKNAVQELRSSLFSLQQNQKFYVIFFDHQTHLMFQGRVDRFRKSRRLKMMHATEDNLSKVKRWLGRVDLGNQTRPRVSFDYGLSLEPDAIFFLTDGEFNDGTYEYLMGIASQTQSPPTIHTVAFGNQLAGRTLEVIADRFNGKYRFVR